MVEAEPMTCGDYNKYKGWTIPENENPSDEGFLVKYSDNYISWSPKQAFDEAYSEIGENELYDTCLLMKSNDFKDRFRAEYRQLENRVEGLRKTLIKYKEGELPFKPKCSYELLYRQLVFMEEYARILDERAEIEGIEL